MRNRKNWRGTGVPRTAAVVAALVLSLAACDTDSILEVRDPDITTPGSLGGPVGRAAVYAGAIADFAVAYDGGAGTGSFRDGYVTTSAYLSDEAYLAGTFPTRTEIDQRSIDLRNGTLENVFERLQRARRATSEAARILQDNDPADNRVAEVQALNGYTFVAFAEGFCSGVPFSTAPLAGELEFGGPQTTTEVLERAVTQFQAASGVADANETILNLSRVGLARALVNLGRFQEAAQAVADVPTDFVYTLDHSISSSRQENGFFASNALTRRLGISNDEGGSGPPYDVTVETQDGTGNGLEFTSGDPRIPFDVLNSAFDATVPQTNLLLAYAPVGIELARNASSPLATGIEARLIEAEAALNGGDPDGALAILNQLRAESDLDLDPLTQPGTAEERVRLLFRERAFWMYATGHRLGDLRRLIRQYGFPENQVFPEGAYFKGGSYGEDVNLPIPQTEVNNPEFTQCLNRNA